MASDTLARLLLASLLTACALLLPSTAQDVSQLRPLQQRLALLQSLATGDAGALEERVRTAMDTFARRWTDLSPAAAESRVAREEVGADLRDVSDRCRKAFANLASTRSKGYINTTVLDDMLDAFAKPPSGVLGGNIYAKGDFDECLKDQPYTQYCFTNVTAYEYKLPFVVSLMAGMCLPSECTLDDVEVELNNTNLLLYESGVPLIVFLGNKDATVCQKDTATHYTPGAIAMIAVCCLFGALALAATLFDLVLRCFASLAAWRRKAQTGRFGTVQGNGDRYDDSSGSSDGLEKAPLLRGSSDQKEQKLPKVFDFVFAFSLCRIVPTILSTKQPAAAITSIHGIRVLSISWVILCHTYFWAATTTGVANSLYVIHEVAPRFSFQPIINGFFSVDSFFFLSGVLTAYLTLRQLSRCHSAANYATVAVMYYVHRILRLTPTYAFVLFFWWAVVPIMADGPIWPLFMGANSSQIVNCEKYWWTNLLYINNIYPWQLKDECLGWTWYLGNDMQFFVIAPIMLIPLFFLLPVGLLCVGAFLVASFAITGALAGHYQYPANQFILNAPHIQGPPWDYTSVLYTKPWSRIQPYLVGVLLGYALYRKARLPYGRCMNWILYLAMWAFAAFLGLSTVYGVYDNFHGHLFSPAANVIYVTFSRFAFGLALALLVFACHNGYGWLVNSFLSLKLWVPLSRLCYNAYLVHPIVLSIIFGSHRKTVYYEDYSMALYAVGIIVLSFGTAAVVTVFVEFPLANLEMTFFKLIGVGGRESSRQVEVHKRRKERL